MKNATQPISFRPAQEVWDAMNRWLEKHNQIDRTALINMAIKHFVSAPQTLEGVQIVAAADDEVMSALGQTMEQHYDAMEKLRKS